MGQRKSSAKLRRTPIAHTDHQTQWLVPNIGRFEHKINWHPEISHQRRLHFNGPGERLATAACERAGAWCSKCLTKRTNALRVGRVGASRRNGPFRAANTLKEALARASAALHRDLSQVAG